MLWPPNYYPVYPFHLRLLDPGLHANPIMQTPSMGHVEGLHTVQWALSDQGKLSTTVSGDNERFALRSFDTGSWIPHFPVPFTLGPFLADTLNNSKYVILFHQPNVLLDGKPVGVFGIGAPPWRCFEFKLPLPKFLAKRSVGGAARKAQKAAAQIKETRKRLEQLDVDYAATEAQIASEQKKLQKHQESVKAEARAHWEARAFADEVDEKEFHQERAAAKEERAEKHKADVAARSARAEADQHEAKANAIYRREIGAPGGAKGTHDEAAAQEKQATLRRLDAIEHDQKARQHGATAKAHQERAKELRKNRSTRVEQSARQYQEKHGEKRNPYKDATGAGNVKVSMPSILMHVAMPATVQIYMGWAAWANTLLRAVLSSLVDLLKGYVGFVFDAMLPQGNGAVAAWAMDFAKGLATGTAYEAAQKYLLEDRLSIKVTQKLGPAAVSAELKRDLQTGEWGWKAAAKPTEDSGLPAGLEVQVDYKEPIKLAGQFHPELTPDFLAQPSSGTAPPAATPQATPGPAPSEASYVCTVDNPPVDYSSGPALSGAPAP